MRPSFGVGGAFEYARGQAWLARGLKRYMADELIEERWSVWTLAEPSVSDARLERFREGGPLCGRGELTRTLIGEVAGAMAQHTSSVWLLPDPMASPGDPFLSNRRAEYIAVDDAIYYLERGQDIDRLTAAWQEANSAAGQMALVTTEAPPGSAPTREHLFAAAAHASLIVMSALVPYGHVLPVGLAGGVIGVLCVLISGRDVYFSTFAVGPLIAQLGLGAIAEVRQRRG